jgi:hypothetical protein
MERLPISIGILAWNSGQVLVDTLTTYHNNGLFDMVNDVTILFQEVNQQDIQIATHFGLDFIGLQKNIGIGKAFLKLTENCCLLLASLNKSSIEFTRIFGSLNVLLAKEPNFASLESVVAKSSAPLDFLATANNSSGITFPPTLPIDPDTIAI